MNECLYIEDFGQKWGVLNIYRLLTKLGNVSSKVGMKQTLLKWPTVSVRFVTGLRGQTVLNLARCRRGCPARYKQSWN